MDMNFTCVIVWKSAPAKLCSCGKLIFATNNVPAAKTKSAPKTVRMEAGKPNAQYGDETLITANKRLAAAVSAVPATRFHDQSCFFSMVEELRQVPIRKTKSTRPTNNATITLQMQPVTNIGNNRTMVRMGVRCKKFW